MTDNYLEKYKEEESVSSNSADDFGPGINEPLKPSNISKPSESQGNFNRVSKREDIEVKPYTFDPKTLLIPEPVSTPSRITGLSGNYNTLTNEPAAGTYKNTKENMERPLPNYYSVNTETYIAKTTRNLDYTKPLNLGSAIKKPQFRFTSSGDYSELKAENDYRNYAKEFDNEFRDHQRDVSTLTRELVSQLKRLQIIYSDLNTPNMDMNLLKAKLLRELETIQANINESNKKLSLLMKDRSKVKEKFCTIKVKNKELKSIIMTCEENIKEYLLT